ncbi:hypothetical protein ACFPYJ_00890 [Paenibacillus solisilvae]|uniref:Uncharacterized protein n=1 Tax=Paenibacillus solisilvae TaxID=2486751 RepID=A0ABW0VPL1_9BACL
MAAFVTVYTTEVGIENFVISGSFKPNDGNDKMGGDRIVMEWGSKHWKGSHTSVITAC